MYLLLALCVAFCFLSVRCFVSCFVFFFFNDTATTEIYTLSLHDALPISHWTHHRQTEGQRSLPGRARRSEEHTSELQSLTNLVCRLLLEKKKKKKTLVTNNIKLKKKPQ